MITDLNIIITYTRERDLKEVSIIEVVYKDNSKAYKIPSENIMALSIAECINIFKNRKNA